MTELGQQIGRYRLLERIGKGGMAEIFKAEERLPDGTTRLVAFKRLMPKLAADREFVGMFMAEARISYAMIHPNIVRTYELLNHGSYYYLVMEFLEGVDLEEILVSAPPREMAMTLAETAYLAHEVALGLGFAHRGGTGRDAISVVHRDISPGNLLLDRAGHVKITDFGIARASSITRVTQPGILKGKYEYMAPEYVLGEEFDGRADLFSLGVVLYEMLTGHSPFGDVMPRDTWHKICTFEPPPPSSLTKSLPTAIDAVVARALAKKPENRFQSGELLAAALKPFFTDIGARSAPKMLGARVSAQLVRRQAGGENASLADFLPPDDDGPTGDRTAEMQVDELLNMVEPSGLSLPASPTAGGGTPPANGVSPPVSQAKLAVASRPASSVSARERSTVAIRPLTAVRLRPVRRTRTIWALVLGSLVLVTGALAGVWWLWPEPIGTLTVNSDRRAEVSVDGKPYGLAPVLRLPLPVGEHLIELLRPGRQQVKTYLREVYADQETSISVQWSSGLKRADESPATVKSKEKPRVSKRKKVRRPKKKTTSKKKKRVKRTPSRKRSR